MKRIIILLLIALTCQAGRAISIDRFFKKYRGMSPTAFRKA